MAIDAALKRAQADLACPAYLDTIRRASFSEVAIVSESSYEAPGMAEDVRGKIISIKVRAVKGR